MAKIASELMIELLAEWRVDTVSGLPGDGTNGIMEGLRRHSDQVKFLTGQPDKAAIGAALFKDKIEQPGH